MTIAVLRLGHRPARDKRVTTHVALTARAFGADAVLVSTRDAGLERGLRSVTARFGGPFEVRTGVPWRETLRGWDGPILHLTMYGEPLDDVLPRIPRSANLLLVVGAEKVPRAVFDLATFNVAVGNQPHSEVAALAVFLDRLLGGAGVRRAFRGRTRGVAQDVFTVDTGGTGTLEGIFPTPLGNVPAKGTWNLTGEQLFATGSRKIVKTLIDIAAVGQVGVLNLPFNLLWTNSTSNLVVRDEWRYPVLVGTSGNVTLNASMAEHVFLQFGTNPPVNTSTVAVTEVAVAVTLASRSNASVPAS